MTDALSASLAVSSAPLVFGDLQGCCDPFQRLLKKAAPEPDTPLWFAGDLINRGPKSLETLRDVIALGSRATVVLGNHDLNLLSVAAGLRKPKKATRSTTSSGHRTAPISSNGCGTSRSPISKTAR